MADIQKKKKSASMMLIIAVFFALLGAILIFSLLSTYADRTEVIVALEDAEPFTEIHPDMLGTIEVPTAAVPEDVIVDEEEVDGKYLSVGVVAETMIRKSHFTDEIEDGHMATVLTELKEPDKRLMRLPYNENTSVGGSVSKGDRIDLVAAFEYQGFPATKVVAADLYVIDVVGGDDLDPSILVPVTPIEAERLSMISIEGSFMALLNPHDRDPYAPATDGIYDLDRFTSDLNKIPEITIDPEELQEDWEERKEEGETGLDGLLDLGEGLFDDFEFGEVDEGVVEDMIEEDRQAILDDSDYIGCHETGVYHAPDCSEVEDIELQDMLGLEEDDEFIDEFEPCDCVE